MGLSPSSLPPELRATLYRRFAAGAIRRSAAALTDELRAGHLSMAAGWRSLAIDIEETLGRFDRTFDKGAEDEWALQRGA